MGLYRWNGTSLAPIAGRGKAEYGASTVRSGSGSTQVDPDNYILVTISFDSAMPDADYEVEFWTAGQAAQLFTVYEKQTTGFKFSVSNLNPPTGSGATIYYKWKAYKLYTDNEYNNILASMPSNASASNKLMAEDEFVVVIANLRNESLPAGIGELYKDIPTPTGYSPFCIVDYDLGRLQGLNITGMSLAATIGKVRIATYCDRAITNELNGSIRVMCKKN